MTSVSNFNIISYIRMSSPLFDNLANFQNFVTRRVLCIFYSGGKLNKGLRFYQTFQVCRLLKFVFFEKQIFEDFEQI